jgi:hypothetical protein
VKVPPALFYGLTIADQQTKQLDASQVESNGLAKITIQSGPSELSNKYNNP